MTQPIEVLKTPEGQFKNLDDYPFNSHYIDIGNGLTMHYLDEGEKHQPVVVLLHGEPSWSYLFRKIIPPLVANGFRVIAPDLIGFGKSDKPVHKSDCTYHHHTIWLQAFLDALDLTSIHLFCHDWGGMIALRIVADQPERFLSVIASYAFLFTGKETIPESFTEWQHFSQTDQVFLAANVVNWGSYSELSKPVKQAYDAPFPDETYKAAARQFPLLIPTHPDDTEAKANVQFRHQLKSFTKPFLTIWGDNTDQMWVGKDLILQREIPGAKGQPHRILHAHHFLQEDQPEEIADILIDFLSNF